MSFLGLVLLSCLISRTWAAYDPGYNCEQNSFFFAVGLFSDRSAPQAAEGGSAVCPSLVQSQLSCCPGGAAFDQAALAAISRAHDAIQFTVDMMHLVMMTVSDLRAAVDIMRQETSRLCSFPAQYSPDGYKAVITQHIDGDFDSWFLLQLLKPAGDVWRKHLSLVQRLGDRALELFHAYLCQACTAPAHLTTPAPGEPYADMTQFWAAGALDVREDELEAIYELVTGEEVAQMISELRIGTLGDKNRSLYQYAQQMVDDCLPYADQRPAIRDPLYKYADEYIMGLIDGTVLGTDTTPEALRRTMRPYVEMAQRILQVVATELPHQVEVNAQDYDGLRHGLWEYRDTCLVALQDALTARYAGDSEWEKLLSPCIPSLGQYRFDPFSLSSEAQAYRAQHAIPARADLLSGGSPLGTDLYLTAQTLGSLPVPPTDLHWQEYVKALVRAVQESYPWPRPSYVSPSDPDRYSAALPASEDPSNSLIERAPILPPYQSGALGSNFVVAVLVLLLALLL